MSKSVTTAQDIWIGCFRSLRYNLSWVCQEARCKNLLSMVSFAQLCLQVYLIFVFVCTSSLMSLRSRHRIVVLLELELGCCSLQRWIVFHFWSSDHSRLFLGCKIATKSSLLAASSWSVGLTTGLHILKTRGTHGTSLLPSEGGLSDWTIIWLSCTFLCAKGLCQVAWCAYLALVSFIVAIDLRNHRGILKRQLFFDYHDIITFKRSLSALVVTDLRYSSGWPIFWHSCGHGPPDILAFVSRDVSKV